ncbi:MAG: adenylate/guanylate cyclase domain-containing protein, partial [Thermodesulfobacteriota bacterium]
MGHGAAGWGIDVEGRPMRHCPWPVTRDGRYRAPLPTEIDRVYGISGEAVAETLAWFEACGGDTAALAEQLNRHAPDGPYRISRSDLTDASRWYTSEYYFYLQMFCKKAMGRYDWHAGEAGNGQLSAHHKIWEKGFLSHLPYGGPDQDSTFSMLCAIFKGYGARGVDFTDLYEWADRLCRQQGAVSFRNEILKMPHTWLSSEFWYYLIEFVKIVTNENSVFAIVEASFDYYDLEGFSFAPDGMLLHVLEYMLNKSTRAYRVEIDHDRGRHQARFRLSRHPEWDPGKTDKYFAACTRNGDQAIMSAYRLVVQKFFRLDLPPRITEVSGLGTGEVAFTFQWDRRVVSVPFTQLLIANLLMAGACLAAGAWSGFRAPFLFLSGALTVNFIIVFYRVYRHYINRIAILKEYLERALAGSREKVEQAEAMTTELLEEKKRLVAERDETARRLRITEVYTRKSLVEMIAAGDDPTRIPPQDRDACVLFADIREFTRLSEDRAPMKIVEMLNDFFDRMNRCIIRENGEIDKLIGDGIMALFDDPDACLRAAVAMCRELRSLNGAGVWPPDRSIAIGIGINSGRVVAGNIGSPSKMDYTVIGDIVNAASRLEALTRHYGVPLIVSEE